MSKPTADRDTDLVGDQLFRIEVRPARENPGVVQVAVKAGGRAHGARHRRPQKIGVRECPGDARIRHVFHAGVGIVLGLETECQVEVRRQRDLVLDESVGEPKRALVGIEQHRPWPRNELVLGDPVASAHDDIVRRSEREAVLRVDVVGVEARRDAARGVAALSRIVDLGLQHRAGIELATPPPQHMSAAHGAALDFARHVFRDAFVDVALQRPGIGARNPVGAEAAAKLVPGIVCVIA